ncbi:undecaprenyl/decaprenyl-phosphate alpha-N-acetylglucosaminyl 1-phosphate transferase [Candidatus Desantisbacteria bacterium]|nr:undecaprenyl/decaprenyl-phosphate alpha-N-acetylglucosaminyl 1-phosphate transferase [Candidatus Desantisbacteria bacterium]
MLISLLGFIFGIIFCFCFVPLVRFIGLRFAIIDLPSKRKVHTDPTPCSGGIAVYLAFFLSLIVMLVFTNTCETMNIVRLFICSTLLLVLGIYDDKWILKPVVKLMGQVVVVLIAIFLGLKINTIGSFQIGWLSVPITLFWFLVFINAVNLIDGIDGLACGIVCIVSLAMFGVALFFNDLPLSILTGCLSGVTAAFLYFNFHQKKIFLGDNGSMLLGFLIASIPVLSASTHKNITMNMFYMTIVGVGVPIYDVLSVIIRRLKAKQSIFKADKQHIHHRLMATGLTPHQVVGILYAITVLLLGLGIIGNGLIISEKICLPMCIRTCKIIKNAQANTQTGSMFGTGSLSLGQFLNQGQSVPVDRVR